MEKTLQLIKVLKEDPHKWRNSACLWMGFYCTNENSPQIYQ